MAISKEIQKSSEMKFNGKLIQVTYDIADVNGKDAWREVVHHPGATAIVAVTEDNKIVMERQFRYALQQTLLEVPAGKLDPNEEPIVCAKRELAEETNWDPDEYVELEYYTLPELLEAIKNEAIKDSKSLAALMLAMPYLK